MSPKLIRKLPVSLVNRIAAGEVIERPASVVKELVENAIDAGSTRVLVETEDGGLGLVRVVDDGCGIPAEQLPLALAEHATSKLENDDDLFRISTKGFRGEAIASIASVSHMRILSRVEGENAAYEVESRGGEHGGVQAAAGNVGTTVEVRNLFFNTPARRKFMKGPGTEMGHISEMVLKLALPHPGVEFEVKHNGRVSLRLPRTSAEGRLLEAWPEDYREQRLAMDARDAEVRIRGVVGLPELAHPTTKYQYLYVNGRPVRDRFIGHALKEAYRGLTEPGRQPAAVLLIEIPPEDVDVNVHPTKVEVRFKNSGRIHGLVMAGVRELLLGADLTPQAKPRASDHDVEPVGGTREGLMASLAEFFRSPPGAGGSGAAGQQQLIELPQPGAVVAAGVAAEVGTFEVVRAGPVAAERVETGTESLRDVGVEAGQADSGKVESAAPVLPKVESPTVPVQTGLSPPTGALQLHNTYLVVETPEGMQIIDQHALHERILFEELFARVTRGTLESQRMLVPATIPASERQVDLVEQIRPLLERLGIEVAAYGPRQIGVTAFPSFLSKLDPAEFVLALLERGEQEILDLSEEELLHDVLDMMACKAAVKAGDPLTPQQMDALLAKRHLVDRSSNCPHGRPTTLKLSLRDLEKQFKRSGF